jgi:fructose-1,6-bisphosphatase II / sedoheptulose-1,7-bisphosphatase
MAFAPRGGLLHAPDTYMDKLAIGPGYNQGIVDIDAPAGENAKAVAKAKGVNVEDVGVCVLDRPRHAAIIESLRGVGARVHLISDGDVAGVIACTDPCTGIDMYVGQGGAPEGVLAAAALKCVGGQMQARLVFRNDDERTRAERVGVKDFKRRYDLNDLASTHAIFAATGVTNGSLLKGVNAADGSIETHSLVMNSATGTIAKIEVKQPKR